jgi:hypothetical protein
MRIKSCKGLGETLRVVRCAGLSDPKPHSGNRQLMGFGNHLLETKPNEHNTCDSFNPTKAN